MSDDREFLREIVTNHRLVVMPSNPIATFDTSKGTFKAELFLDKTPVTASNFVDLAKTGFYDGLHFHRVIEGFMLVRASMRRDATRETYESVFRMRAEAPPIDGDDETRAQARIR